MKQDPKDEDGTEACPHVASAAAAFGDPSGKYAAFLSRMCPGYQSKPFWFYDQPGALKNASGAGSQQKRADTLTGPSDIPAFRCPVEKYVPGLSSAPEEDCVYKDCVQLDNDVFASCEELKPFYEEPLANVASPVE